MSVAWAPNAWATDSWIGMNGGPPNAWRGESGPAPVVVVDRSIAGGPPKVRWGEWTTPFTPIAAVDDIRAIVAKALGESYEKLSTREVIERREQVERAAVDREIAARRALEEAKNKRERKAAKVERERARKEREATLGRAYSAALDAALARYMERGNALIALQRADDDAVALLLLMH